MHYGAIRIDFVKDPFNSCIFFEVILPLDFRIEVCYTKNRRNSARNIIQNGDYIQWEKQEAK